MHIHHTHTPAHMHTIHAHTPLHKCYVPILCVQKGHDAAAKGPYVPLHLDANGFGIAQNPEHKFEKSLWFVFGCNLSVVMFNMERSIIRNNIEMNIHCIHTQHTREYT